MSTTDYALYSNETFICEGATGTLPDEVYASSLNWWRNGIRRVLVQNLEQESRWIGMLQKKIRTPFLDAYFVYTSSLGTHTFFMIFLPLLYFFGYFEIGFGLVFISAAGVYFTSFLKDLICVPRPFMHHVTRLSMGNHHLEYGFPSTHSTNCISVAVYLYLLLSSSTLAESPLIFHFSCALLAVYGFSIVFGRIYCGMHSFTDCIAGSALGAVITLTWWHFGPTIHDAIASDGFRAPILITIGWIVVINQHPQPVDNCPCFEDSIAFVSVVSGLSLSVWHARYIGVDKESGFFKLSMPGSSFENASDILLYSLVASLKTVLGISVVFAFRLALKPTLQTLLPPTFRLLATLFTLPHRRWYTPATEYGHVPPEHVLGRRRGVGISVPSVIDLPSTLSEHYVTPMNPAAPYGSLNSDGLKRRRVEGSSEKTTFSLDQEGENANTESSDGEVRHYDADVLTRVVVYSGIGVLVAEIIPVCFELVGWGL